MERSVLLAIVVLVCWAGTSAVHSDGHEQERLDTNSQLEVQDTREVAKESIMPWKLLSFNRLTSWETSNKNAVSKAKATGRVKSKPDKTTNKKKDKSKTKKKEKKKKKNTTSRRRRRRKAPKKSAKKKSPKPKKKSGKKGNKPKSKPTRRRYGKRSATVIMANKPLDSSGVESIKAEPKRLFCRSSKSCPAGQRCVGYDPMVRDARGRRMVGVCVKKSPSNQPCSKSKRCPSGYFCSSNSHAKGRNSGWCTKKRSLSQLFRPIGKKIIMAKDRLAKLLQGYKPYKGGKGKAKSKEKRSSLLSLKEKTSMFQQRNGEKLFPSLAIWAWALPKLFPDELNKHSVGSIPWCGEEQCDARQTRDRYREPKITAAFEMTFHVLKKTAKGKARTSVAKLKQSLAEVNKVYSKAKVKFAFKLVEHVAPELYHTVVGETANCQAADATFDDSFNVKVKKKATVSWVGTQRVTYEKKETNKKYYFLKGDTVNIGLYIGGVAGDSVVEICAFGCGEDSKCKKKNRKMIKCYNRTQDQAMLDETVTLKEHGYHGVQVTNHNQTHTVDTFVTAAYSRAASCIDPTSFLQSLEPDYLTKWTPFNVIVTDFVASADDDGRFYKALHGIGFYPWHENRGIVMMKYSKLGRGSKNLLAHEFGHTLGLLHTFHGTDDIENAAACPRCAELPSLTEDQRDEVGDFCGDTAPGFKDWKCGNTYDTFECGKGTSTAVNITLTKATGKQPYKNIMSYSPCRKDITPDQVARIRCYVSHTSRIRWAIRTLAQK